MNRGWYYRTMRSKKLQLLLTLLALLTGIAILIAKGPPPEEGALTAAAVGGDVAECQRALGWVYPINERTSSGSSSDWTPLHWAVEYGHRDVVALLISRGADPNPRSYGGWTPLHVAVQDGQRDMAELLIALGADVNARSRAGFGAQTPLHSAAEHGKNDMAELLLAKGAAVDARTEDGETPLHLAAEDAATACVLLAHRADVNAQDAKGRTPLHQAAYLSNLSVVALLVAHGANVTAKDHAGKTPLAAANDPRFDDGDASEAVANFLRQHGAKE